MQGLKILKGLGSNKGRNLVLLNWTRFPQPTTGTFSVSVLRSVHLNNDHIVLCDIGPKKKEPGFTASCLVCVSNTQFSYYIAHLVIYNTRSWTYVAGNEIEGNVGNTMIILSRSHEQW